ncbi:recombinase family protein [Actinopolyspora halophila]|uniref:recombinase family protein n=1 Tax=Actinopolyspora halophila TaxID=1850 RepID=UPI000376F655|nr:recombinase family protein [Actinopolyspora halophila]
MTAARKARATAPRAVLYLRQSAHREESISLEIQETAGREYCARMGYTVVAVLSDPGISGLKWDKRKGLQQTLTMARNGEIERAIVYRWSRLSRQRLHQQMALDAIEKTGALVESSTEPVDTSTAGGEFSRDVMLAAAALDSRQKGEQWGETHKWRREAGLPASGGHRYGYTWICDSDHEYYEPEPEEAATVRWMYKSYIAGRGLSAITKELNRAGIPNKRGREWNAKSLRILLDSGFAAGLLSRDIMRGGKVVNDAIDRREWLDGVHEPIIDRDTWVQYKRARLERLDQPARSTNPSHPLSGLTYCGDSECGHGPMVRKRTNGHYLFSCAHHLQRAIGRPCNIMEKRLYPVVFEWLQELADDVGDAAARARDVEAAQLRARTDVDQARRELDEVDKRLTNLRRHLIAERITDAEYDQDRAELIERRATLETRIARAEEQQQHSGPAPQEIAEGLLAEWPSLEVLERRELLSRLIRRIVITPGAYRGAPATVAIASRWDSD